MTFMSTVLEKAAPIYITIILLVRPKKNVLLLRGKPLFCFLNLIYMLFGRNLEFATCKRVACAQLLGYFECFDEY
jgi:hypothetical protein